MIDFMMAKSDTNQTNQKKNIYTFHKENKIVSNGWNIYMDVWSYKSFELVGVHMKAEHGRWCYDSIV